MRKFIGALLISFLTFAQDKNEMPLETDDIDLVNESINLFNQRGGSTGAVTNKFYNIPIENSGISTTSSTAGIELKQSGRYYIANALRRVPASGKPVIKITGSNIILDMNGFVIDGALATSSHTDMIGIEVAANVTNIKIINGQLNNIKGMGIKAGAGVDTLTFENLKITNCNDTGIELIGTSGSKIKNLTMRNVEVSSGDGSQRDTSADAYGLKADYVVSGSIENCNFQNMVPSENGKDGIGVYFNACENISCSGCNANNNKASSSVIIDSDGSLDTSNFGSPDGYVTTPIGSNDDQARSVAIQSDGKIVVAGFYRASNYDFAVARYDTDGSLDTTFGTGGKVTTAIGSNDDYAQSVAIQSDGKIIVVGLSSNGANFDFAVARYDTDGSLDTTFGTGGKVTTAIGSNDDKAYSVAIQSDGKIVVAGDSYNGSNKDFAVVRYNTDGSLDTTFDSDGKVTTAIGSSNDSAYSVVIQSDGKIVAAGYSHNGSNYDFAVARYDTDGSLDTTFDTDGKVTTTTTSTDNEGILAAIQSDGKIVVAGNSHNGSNYDFAVVRYDTDGSLDTTFDSDGKVTTAIGSGNDSAYSVAIQSDGKIVAAGYSHNGSNNDFAVARYSGPTTYGSGKGMYLTGTSKGCVFSDCNVNNISGNSVGSAYSFYLDAAKDCVFKNCEAASNSGGNDSAVGVAGFRLESASTNNSFVNCNSSGHTVSGTSSTVYGWQIASNNNRFESCFGSSIGSSSGGLAYGFYLSSVESNLLKNCEAFGCQSSGSTNCYGFFSTAGRSNVFDSCKGSGNKAATGTCAGIALDAAETLSSISNGEFSSNQVTGAGSCYGIVLDPANSSGVNKCTITNNNASMNLATTNTATLAGFRDFTADSNSLISGNTFALNGNAVLNIGSAPDYNIDSSDLTIDGSGNGGLNMYLTYNSGQNIADIVNETDVSNMQALSSSLMGWTNLLVVPNQVS